MINRKPGAVLAASFLALGCVAFAAGISGSASAKPSPSPSYTAVQSLLDNHCAMCHNDSRHAAGVDLASYTKLMKGGKHGPTVVPGHPEKSSLILFVNGARQPRMPLRQPPLSQKQIGLLTAWVKAGAKA